MVRNRNGKNSRKLEFTAPGLPVLRAIAYPNPENARLHIAPSKMKATIPSGPVSNRTPTMNPTMRIGTISSARDGHVGHQMAEQDRQPSHGCEQQPVEVAVLHVEDECRCTRDPGDSEQDRRRQLERGEVEALDLSLGELGQGADVHEEEEQGDEDRRDHRFEIARNCSQRSSGNRRRVGEEPSGARFDGRRLVTESCS